MIAFSKKLIIAEKLLDTERILAIVWYTRETWFGKEGEDMYSNRLKSKFLKLILFSKKKNAVLVRTKQFKKKI
jgi:hypothetical protein